MNYKIILATAIASLLTASTFANILPDTQTTVEVSHREPNRIICQSGSVQEVVKADEHPVDVSYTGNQAFVRFKVGVTTTLGEAGETLSEQKEYYRNTVDIYVICQGDEVYNLILQPKPIHSQTIRVGSAKKQAIQETLANFRGKDLRERAITIAQHLERDELPPAWDITHIRKEIPAFREIQTWHRRTVEIPGTGLRAQEFLLVANETVTLDEKQFLSPKLTTAPYGVTLLDTHLNAGEQTRLFIIERTGGS